MKTEVKSKNEKQNELQKNRKGKSMMKNVEMYTEYKEFEETKERQKLKSCRELLQEEDGMGTVEVILIVVVLVGLVIIFKDQITQIVNNLFNKITSQTGKV